MSILGTLSRRHSSVPSNPMNACSRFAYELPSLLDTPDHNNGRPGRTARRKGFTNTRVRRNDGSQLEDVFIRSLVAAGHCTQHRASRTNTWQQGTRGWRTSSKNQGMNTSGSKRFLSTNLVSRENALATASEDFEDMPIPEITKDEYKNMVNTYGLPSDMWDQANMQPAFGLHGQSRKNKQRYPLAPRLVVQPEEEARLPQAARKVLEPETEQHMRDLKLLRHLLRRPHGTVSHDTLWNTYMNLQTPRLRYMDDAMIRTLFGHLTWIEKVHTADRARQRYFSLLDDCIGEEIPLTVIEWSAAMQFAGHAAKKGTDNEVKDAIELWLKMEESGIKANNVTFNILFFVAIKAGRYALADTIHNELKTRNMELDRYFRVSMIFYAGHRGEGDGVRKAFNDMVNAGEVIDTAVMNCVMAALLRSGESAAADNVFQKMIALHESKFGTVGPDDWRGQRTLAKLLNKTGKELRAEREAHEKSFFGGSHASDDRREEIQRASPIAPNARTYRILIAEHAKVLGDLERVKDLLADKKKRGFHVHGTVYVNIFAAFIIHGGYAHSVWKPSALEAFWKEFVDASSEPNAGYWLSSGSEENVTLHFNLGSSDGDPTPDGARREDDEMGLNSASEEDRAPYFTLNMAITTLRAFQKCIGTPRMLEVWEEMKARWKHCGKQERESIEVLIANLQRRDL